MTCAGQQHAGAQGCRLLLVVWGLPSLQLSGLQQGGDGSVPVLGTDAKQCGWPAAGWLADRRAE
jgi:hypothetical protein